MQDTPSYQAPAPDPAFAALQAQTDKQRQDATQLDLEALNARHAMMYGTRVNLGGGGGWFTPATWDRAYASGTSGGGFLNQPARSGF